MLDFRALRDSVSKRVRTSRQSLYEAMLTKKAIKYLLILACLSFSIQAKATSVLERNLVECTISTYGAFEEIALKSVTLEDGDLNTFHSYTLDHLSGDLNAYETDILGAHEQVRDRIFTSANANNDGLYPDMGRDYQLITEFDHSELIVFLLYAGVNQYGFETYEIELDGYGPVFDLVFDRFHRILDRSDHYEAYDRPLCVTHFNLDDFVQ